MKQSEKQPSDNNVNKIIKTNITAVVCTLNAEDTIEGCLTSIIGSGIEKIILVDANSSDETRTYASPLVSMILTDPGKGLALARNIGIAKVTTDYVLNCGADNIVNSKAIEMMLLGLQDRNVAGTSAMTRLQNSNKHYFTWAQNLYKSARYYPGARNVIGTPNLFRTKLLIENPYDAAMGFSDDGDLCTRLCEKGYKFLITDAYINEVGCDSFAQILKRWRMYGISDYQTYRKYSKTWRFRRKISSF